MDIGGLVQLASGLHGSVITAEDDQYDAARSVWNGTVDKHPKLIVSCEGSDDVVEAILYARRHELGVSVRNAGHHVAGLSVLEDGMVIDLSRMRTVEVDRATRLVRAAGGAQIGDVDAATQRYGLAVPLGVVSETGVTGLTLAGGYGWMRRKYGLSCDNVTSADVVTADGRRLRASLDENPELFWALCGGGWDLAVVTALEYEAHPVGPDVYLNFVVYDAAETEQVLANLREFAEKAPPELSPLAILMTLPSAEPFPEDLWGRSVAAIVAPFIGDLTRAEETSSPLTGFGSPLVDLSAVTPWVDVQRIFDEDFPRGMRYYWRATHLRDLGAEAGATLAELAANRPSSLSTVDVWVNGGAIMEVPVDGTPVATRSAPYMIGLESNWEDPGQDGANTTWTRAAAKSLEPYASGGAYLNFDDPSDPGTLHRAHGENSERLAEIKSEYDPANLFRSRGVRI